jgi:hypothetical protein
MNFQTIARRHLVSLPGLTSSRHAPSYLRFAIYKNALPRLKGKWWHCRI